LYICTSDKMVVEAPSGNIGGYQLTRTSTPPQHSKFEADERIKNNTLLQPFCATTTLYPWQNNLFCHDYT